MKKAIAKGVIVAAIGLALALFSPWVTESFARSKALNAFEAKWSHTADGCGLACKDCGYKSSRKVLFGRKVEIEYACGLLPADSPEYHKRQELFVSFIGTVHGV